MMRWDETWRALGSQILEEMNQLDNKNRIEWLAEWRARSLPYAEFLRILWRWAVLPRESESASYVVDIVDLGLLTESLTQHPMETGWVIVDRVLADLLQRRSRLLVDAYPTHESKGLQQAWSTRRPDVADWETKLVMEREGLEGLLDRVIQYPLPQDIGTSLPSLWRVSMSLASYWAGEDSWSLMRLASRWQAMEPTPDASRGLVGWTVEEASGARSLDYGRYFRDKFNESVAGVKRVQASPPAHPDFDDGKVHTLLQSFAAVSSSIKTENFRWYASQLLLESLSHPDNRALDFLSWHVLGALDVMWLSRAHRAANEERRLVWSALGWGMAAFFAVGHPGTPDSGDTVKEDHLAVEEVWGAIDRGESEVAARMAQGLGESVYELWPLLQEESSVMGQSVGIRMVAAAERARCFAPPLADYRLLPMVVRILTRCRATIVGAV